jgi:hypothetical protein
MDAFTLGMLGLLIFSLSSLAAVCISTMRNRRKKKASQRLKSNCDNERKGQQ